MYDDKRRRETLPINDAANGRHDRRGEDISGVKIEIGVGKGVHRFRGARFSDCEIRIRRAGNVTPVSFGNCLFENCLIWPAKQHEFSTWDATFIGCKFKGKFEGRFAGRLVNCDLTDATLLSAQFSEPDDGTNLWPAFPHIVVKDIEKNFSDWHATPSTAKISITDVGPRIKASTIVLYLPHLVSDSEEFWASIKDKNYVFTN